MKTQIKDAETGLATIRADMKACTDNRVRVQAQEADAFAALEALQEKFGPVYFRELGCLAVQECPENSLDDLLAKIESLKIDLDAAIDNPEILIRYNTTEAEHVDALREKAEQQASFDSVDGDMQFRMKRWLEAVNAGELLSSIKNVLYF